LKIYATISLPESFRSTRINQCKHGCIYKRIDGLFTVYVPLKNFSLTIVGEGLQNLGLCSALRAFEEEGIFIVPHLLRHGTSVFPVSSKGPPLSVASYDTRGDVEDLF
jgi:hypothetical protein